MAATGRAVSARSSKRRSPARCVAWSFDAWYRGWLDALVRDVDEFAHRDAEKCATPSVLSQVLDLLEGEGLEPDAAVAELPTRLGAGAIGLASGGGTYFDEGEALDPCQPCSKLVSGLGLDLDVFKPGVPPKHAREDRRGVLGRLFGRTRM